MSEMKPANDEETLDPQDWNAMRALGHRMVDDMMTYLQSVRERPVWQPVPEDVKRQLNEPLPLESHDPATVYEEFLKNILPYPTGNIHPRFWGWVMGNGTPLGMLSDMLASGMNAHVAGYDQAATIVECQVIEWLKELFVMPREASGLLVSGGTMANLVGLTVGRNAKAGFDLRRHGLQSSNAPKLLVYGSTETHSWAQKAVELLGLGVESLRSVAVDSNFEIDIDALRDVVAADRAAGHRPFCVIGNAGTVNTGATDDLVALADFCQQESLWFHVDGAFGALAAMSPKYRYVVAGMERADSLAFDLHKWVYLPYEVGGVIVRDEQVHRGAFSLTPTYLTSSQRGISVETTYFADLGIQLSRGFRALKVWTAFKTHGALLIGRMIEQNIEQAKYLQVLVEAHSNLELLAPVPLNVVCFRFRINGSGEDALDKLNEEILWRVQESGVAVPSGTRINGRFALRVAITNHRSRREDFDMLISKVLELGTNLSRGET